MISAAAKNSNKFQKIRFWKEKSVEDVVTLGPTAKAVLVQMKERMYRTILDMLVITGNWLMT